jgi:hypothetical protein
MILIICAANWAFSSPELCQGQIVCSAIQRFVSLSPPTLLLSELLFQISDQLKEALCGDGIVEQGNRPLGLFQAPLRFFSVALFNHGRHSLFSKTRDRRDSFTLFRSSTWNGFKTARRTIYFALSL